jgi:hypothetical protein
MSATSDNVEQIKDQLDHAWIGHIYGDRILKMRTRSYQFPSNSKLGVPEIHHTLLGIELKVGRRRMLCPDLATARYLAVFARLGCREVAIPYDITKISHVADELESSWHRMLLLVEKTARDRSPAFRTRLRTLVVGKVRAEIAAAGAGTRIPEFKRTTSQRRR